MNDMQKTSDWDRSPVHRGDQGLRPRTCRVSPPARPAHLSTTGHPPPGIRRSPNVSHQILLPPKGQLLDVLLANAVGGAGLSLTGDQAAPRFRSSCRFRSSRQQEAPERSRQHPFYSEAVAPRPKTGRIKSHTNGRFRGGEDALRIV